MRVLAAAIVLSSIILGSTQALGGTSRQASAATFPAIPPVCTGLTLHLQARVLQADGSPMSGWTVAQDIPLDPVDAVVPLYPGATLTTKRLAQPSFGWQGSQYVKTAVAEFSVPTDARSAIAWYKNTFTKCGFVVQSRLGTNPLHRVSIGGFDFVSPTTTSLRVFVTAYKRGGTNAIALHYAGAVSPPPRPPADGVSGSQKSVRVP